MALHIRDAHPAEIAAACALWRRAESARTGSATADADTLEFTDSMRAAARKPGARLLVGFWDGDLVAAIYGVPLRTDRTRAQVAMLCVEPTRWGTGAGTAMLVAMTEALREQGCRQLRMNVDPSNVRARRLYERHGWRHIGETELAGDESVRELIYRAVVPALDPD